ncbi:TetR/AcrR family transcriptional regulator [Amycolatopsis acidiphila]|uniref:TetR/AcrR family transcriptional regulator n=1 Tax=Amycolatopsis acidiphila TaxID=715473 RepID=UPI00199A6D35|nr:TetR/AcrR family transcriptional regulator [Amycolatopsis acidiphila]UIJ63500.1 TetR/AcrR family transcriptional regulator [Amycolatopsis acidiphila]GHG68570.1 TetR family transcriptional regulator [Amycolatopsis acidiphila]
MTPSGTSARRRAERTANSRALILDAAVDCLVELGYAGASTLAIQAKAGVSRGRLLHHFPSREGLLVAAAQHLATTRLKETEERVATDLAGEPDGPRRVDRCVELLWSTFQEPHFWAAMELWTAARTNPALAAALRPAERALRDAIRAVTDRIWGPAVAAHPAFPELRELLFTSMRGAALPYAFEDRPAATDPHVRIWKSAARRVLFGAPPSVAPSGSRRRGGSPRR